MTANGGVYDDGVLFKINGDGSGFSNTHNFNDTLGEYPVGKLLFNFNDNKFYGMTGAGGGVNFLVGGGVLFSFDSLANTYADLYNFSEGDSGHYPASSLIQLNNGLLYGNTSEGGPTQVGGLIFSFNSTNNMYSDLFNFDTTFLKTPYGDFVEFGTNTLYGMLASGGITGGHGAGGIYKFDVTANTYTDLYHFDFYHGDVPQGNALIVASNNLLYGMTYGGGDTTNNFTQGYGVIFSFDTAANIVTNLLNFNGTNGHRPYGCLLQASNGLLYGMTESGGTSNEGVIFSFDITTNTEIVVVNFNGTNGANPRGSLMQASDGKLYGMATSGGLNNKGLIFSYDINTNIFTDIHDFTGADGAFPVRELVEVIQCTTPSISISGNINICSGNSTILNAHGASIYAWQSLNSTDSIITVSPTTTTTYIVSGRNYNCNNAVTDTITVTVNPLPSLVITGDTSFCSGNSSTLNAGSFAHYIWNTGSTAQTITVDSATTYHITVTDANGCTGIASRTITVYPLPHPVITSNGSDTFCQGNSVMLTVGIYPGYLWNTSATTPSITAIDSTTYIVTVTNANGCTGTASRTITVHASPSPTISGGNTICSGDSLILNVGSFAHYLWNNGITTQSINATASGNYSITVTNSGGCIGIASETVSVTANPVPVIAPASPINLCEGENVTLHASNGILYNWSNGATTQYLDVSTSGAYIVTVTYGVNCSNTSAPTDVIVHPLPLATIAALPENLEFCIGDSILLTANSSTSPITYLWNQGSTTQSIEATQSGDFTVTVTDTIGCHSSSSINLTSYLYPVANFTYSMFLNTTTFTNTSSNGTAYQWYFGDGNVSTLMNPTHTYSHDSTYTITLIVTNPCGADTVRYTITLTGINEINRSDKFIIYPNPANSTITLHIPMSIVSCQLSIENVLGEEIYKGTLSGIDNIINVLDWSEGVYFITIRSQETISTQKFIKL